MKTEAQYKNTSSSGSNTIINIAKRVRKFSQTSLKNSIRVLACSTDDCEIHKHIRKPDLEDSKDYSKTRHSN